MVSNALRNLSSTNKKARTETPIHKRTPGRTDEIQNSSGAFVFKVSDKDRLERFLILGTDGGSFYAGERKLTEQNATFVKTLIGKNERLVVDTIVDVSDNGRAAKNSPALFALALVFTYGKDKAYARQAVNKVARTSTHLFEFAQYIDDLGGWGRAKRASVADWFVSKTPEQLAYQAVKYRSRTI